jgi:hypothetical protein
MDDRSCLRNESAKATQPPMIRLPLDTSQFCAGPGPFKGACATRFPAAHTRWGETMALMIRPVADAGPTQPRAARVDFTYAIGLTARPFNQTSKWQWDPVERPVDPTFAITCPACTRVPTSATNAELCA